MAKTAKEKRKCGECIYLRGEVTVLGIGCMHPDKKNSIVANPYYRKTTPACSKFTESEEKEDGDDK